MYSYMMTNVTSSIKVQNKRLKCLIMYFYLFYFHMTCFILYIDYYMFFLKYKLINSYKNMNCNKITQLRFSGTIQMRIFVSLYIILPMGVQTSKNIFISGMAMGEKLCGRVVNVNYIIV